MKWKWDIFGKFSNNVKSFLLEFKLPNHKNPRQFFIIKQKLQNLPNVFCNFPEGLIELLNHFCIEVSRIVSLTLCIELPSVKSEKMQIQVVRFTRHDSLLNCHYPGFLYFISLVHNGQKSTQKASLILHSLKVTSTTF